jgi:thiol-disulfide isomerase/thioredoxin
MALLGSLSKNLFSARSFIIIAVVVALLAVAFATYYIYTQRNSKAFVPNAEYYPDEGKGDQPGPSGVGAIKLTMYGVPWCPHSRAAMKPWNEWSEKHNEKEVGGVKVVCKTVNCEEDEMECKNADIKGYPTVIAETPMGDTVIMDAKTTISSLDDFMGKVSTSVRTGNPLS